eukprot:gene10438-biopygen6787
MPKPSSFPRILTVVIRHPRVAENVDGLVEQVLEHVFVGDLLSDHDADRPDHCRAERVLGVCLRERLPGLRHPGHQLYRLAQPLIEAGEALPAAADQLPRQRGPSAGASKKRSQTSAPAHCDDTSRPSQGDVARIRRGPAVAEGDVAGIRRGPAVAEGYVARIRRGPAVAEGDVAGIRRGPAEVCLGWVGCACKHSAASPRRGPAVAEAGGRTAQWPQAFAPRRRVQSPQAVLLPEEEQHPRARGVVADGEEDAHAPHDPRHLRRGVDPHGMPRRAGRLARPRTGRAAGLGAHSLGASVRAAQAVGQPQRVHRPLRAAEPRRDAAAVEEHADQVQRKAGDDVAR